MRAIILAGRGSPEAGTGGVLIRLAARARSAGIAPLVVACFLDYGRPSFEEALAQCVNQGAREIVVIPYALALTEHARAGLEQLVDAARTRYLHVLLSVTEAIGDHPALAQVLLQRAVEADYLAAHPQVLHRDPVIWPGWQSSHAVSLLIVLDDASILPLTIGEEALKRCGGAPRYTTVQLCFIHGGKPHLETAIESLADRGDSAVIVVPYTLERHTPFLPAVEAAIAAARARHPLVTIIQSEHLAYDRRLLAAIAERACWAGAEEPGANAPT